MIPFVIDVCMLEVSENLGGGFDGSPTAVPVES